MKKLIVASLIVAGCSTSVIEGTPVVIKGKYEIYTITHNSTVAQLIGSDTKLRVGPSAAFLTAWEADRVQAVERATGCRVVGQKISQPALQKSPTGIIINYPISCN